jgi:MoxR-like ATPase
VRPSDRQLRTIRSLQAVSRDLDARFVGRGDATALLVLAVVAREHVLLIGPPGTARTDLIQRFAALIQARRFNYLLTRFTEPSEIFGPLDFELFQTGSYQIRTADMLPAAEVVFLDEVFQGSSAILNTLLTLINERRFYNGAKSESSCLTTPRCGRSATGSCCASSLSRLAPPGCPSSWTGAGSRNATASARAASRRPC